MKQLKEYFSGIGQVKGYVFSQISKTKYGFLYEVRGDGTIHYEVFYKKVNSLYDCISYPTDKAFGVWAWTAANLERAKEILNTIDSKGLEKEIL